MKKHDEDRLPSTVVVTDAPLGSKLDGIRDPAIRENVAARLRLMEAMLLDRIELAESASEAESDPAPEAASPAKVDVAKARAIADQLKKKPQA